MFGFTPQSVFPCTAFSATQQQWTDQPDEPTVVHLVPFDFAHAHLNFYFHPGFDLSYPSSRVAT